MSIEKLLTGIFLLAVVILPSCTEDGGMPEDDYPDLTSFLHRFENEAAKLGYDFDLSKIQAAYVDEIKMNGIQYCGYGYVNYDGAGLRRIEISRSSSCQWKEHRDIERENLFFHEIGHTFFLRPHDETKQCDGSPLSLMTSTTNNWATYGESEDEKRTYYISELIDPLVALDKCIGYGRDWSVDSVLYTFSKDDKEWIFDPVDGNYSGEQGPNEDVLSIASNPLTSTSKNGYWFRQFQGLAIPECAKVKLKVRMNSSTLTGVGAAISVRAYYAPVFHEGALTEQLFRISTEDNPVAGQLVDYREAIDVPCYTRKITTLIIFVVMLGDSQGEVDFDEIQVVVKE